MKNMTPQTNFMTKFYDEFFMTDNCCIYILTWYFSSFPCLVSTPDDDTSAVLKPVTLFHL